MNRSMQYFVMVSNKAVQLHLEKLMNSVAINPYFLKNYFCSSVLQELRENPFSNSICMGEFL